MASYEELLQESRTMRGGLGAVAYGILKGLYLGGATEGEVAEVERQLHVYLPHLSAEECDTLCRVMFERLSEARHPEGRWYA